jgi:hypothetical protein
MRKMFRENRWVLLAFAATAMLNAYAITEGWYR